MGSEVPGLNTDPERVAVATQGRFSDQALVEAANQEAVRGVAERPPRPLQSGVRRSPRRGGGLLRATRVVEKELRRAMLGGVVHCRQL